jgi:hypothetical protein
MPAMKRFSSQLETTVTRIRLKLFRQSGLLLLGSCLLCFGCKESGSQPQAVAPADPVAPAMPAQRAAAGLAQQGASRADDTAAQKIMTGAAHEYFQFKQRAVFVIQIPKALELYKALNGAGPKNHSEFDREIVKANQILLPELKPGMVYRFNAEKQELWVYPESEAPSAD